MGVEFAVSGHRELDNMVAHYAELARLLAEQLGLSESVLEAIGAAYEQWDGTGWPGALRGEDVPVAARVSQVAEFAEVAHRVGGVAEVRTLATRGWRGQFDPGLVNALVADADLILADLDRLQTWDAVIGAEPSLAVSLSEDRFDAALEAVANFVDLKSPYLLGHSRAVADLAAVAATSLRSTPDEVRTVRRAGLVHGSDGSASRTPSGTSAAHSGPASGSGSACIPI